MKASKFVISFLESNPLCPDTRSTQYYHVSAGANGVTADGVKMLLATALGGYLAGKRLSVAFDDSTSACNVARLRILD